MNSELVSLAIATEDVVTVENDERAQGEMRGFEKVWEEENRRVRAIRQGAEERRKRRAAEIEEKDRLLKENEEEIRGREEDEGTDGLFEEFGDWLAGESTEVREPSSSSSGAAVREEAEEHSKAAETEKKGEESAGLSQEKADGDEDEEQAEARTPKRAYGPPRVSQRERDEHDATHMPFRAWCKHCVAGKARNQMHKRKGKDEGDEDKTPRISMDYFFMSEEDKKASKNPILVMVDEQTKDKYARAVGQKGLGNLGEMDWLVKDMSTEMKVWGHAGGEGGTVILKSDGERAIVAVRNAVGSYHCGRIIPEAPSEGR